MNGKVVKAFIETTSCFFLLLIRGLEVSCTNFVIKRFSYSISLKGK